MEVHRQRCQACSGREMHNIIVRDPGQRQVVLVRCVSCKELVARYELASYYHHGKGIESWLKTMAIATESAIDLQDTFAQVSAHAPQDLEKALQCLHELNKDD